TELENLAAERLRPRDLIGHVGVEEYERMQIAVARMEDIGATQAILAFHLPDRLQHRRETLAWNGAVHAVVVRRERAHRGKGGLAPRPEAQPFRLVAGDAAIGGSGAAQHGFHAQNLLRDLVLRAVGLAEQDGLRIEWIPGAHERLHRSYRGAIHHLE